MAQITVCAPNNIPEKSEGIHVLLYITNKCMSKRHNIEFEKLKNTRNLVLRAFLNIC